MNQTRVTPNKKKEPRCFLSLFTPLNPANLSSCFSFFFYEYLTLAPRVALCLGSLPLALGGQRQVKQPENIFPSQNTNTLPAKPRDQHPSSIRLRHLSAAADCSTGWNLITTTEEVQVRVAYWANKAPEERNAEQNQ